MCKERGASVTVICNWNPIYDHPLKDFACIHIPLQNIHNDIRISH